MVDSFRFSVVAQSKDPGAPPDTTIEESIKKLTPLTTVVRAASMEDLFLRVRDAVNDPKRAGRKLAMQLVGHGTSGLLHLGSSWMGEPLPPETFADPFFLLDTNPWALAYIGEFREMFDRVILAACRVGASDAEGYAINGRTLAYTLCELLRTDVIAAMDFTDADEWDAQGEYAPKATHLKPCTWSWKASVPVYSNPNATPLVLKVRPGAAPINFRIKRIRALIPSHVRETAADIEVRAFPIDDPSVAAARPELGVVLDGINAPAWVLGNGRVLRIAGDVFAISEPASASRAIALQLSKPA